MNFHKQNFVILLLAFFVISLQVIMWRKEEKNIAIRCIPSFIRIDQQTQTVITTIDCEKWQNFIASWFDTWIHVITGDYSDIVWPDAEDLPFLIE